LQNDMPAPPRRRLLVSAAGAAAAALAPRASVAGAPPALTAASFPDLDRALRGALPAWQAVAGRPAVRVASLSTADHHTAMMTAMAAGSNLPDLMAIDIDYIGKFAASGGLTDLSRPPFDALAHREQLPAFALAAATNRRGELAALPVDIGPGALFYRADLLAAAGLTAADLARSWEDFIEAGRRLRRAHGVYLVAHAASVSQVVVRSGLRDGEGVFFDAQGEPLVETPRFRRAFELARSVRRAELDGRMSDWSNEWTEALRRGRVATQMMGCWLGGHLKNWIAPKSAGLWRSALLPGGAASYWGGSFYAIPKHAPQPEAAWAFLKHLALDRQQQLAAFRDLDAFPVLRAAQSDPFMDEPMPFLGGQRARQQWRDTAARIPALAVDRYDGVARQVVAAELAKVLQYDKDIGLALADARTALMRRIRRHA
jgi:multiple sugar transport system substrate-binding protein